MRKMILIYCALGVIAFVIIYATHVGWYGLVPPLVMLPGGVCYMLGYEDGGDAEQQRWRKWREQKAAALAVTADDLSGRD